MTNCKHLRGYWINEGVSFRCYDCQSQFNVMEIEHDPGRKIEVWEGSGSMMTECDDCGEEVEEVMICPDGAEICKACFDAGAH